MVVNKYHSHKEFLLHLKLEIHINLVAFMFVHRRIEESNSNFLFVSTTAMVFQKVNIGMWETKECKNSYMEMKWKKVHKFIVFKIDERSRLAKVAKVGGPDENYVDLAASLLKDDCRNADLDFVTVDNCRKSKISFITRSPAASRIRAKILYATSKDGLRRDLEGISYEDGESICVTVSSMHGNQNVVVDEGGSWQLLSP